MDLKTQNAWTISDPVPAGGGGSGALTEDKKDDANDTDNAEETVETVKIPSKITVDGVSYKVTAIANKAFNKLKKKAVVKAPSSKKKAYKKLLKKSGYTGTVK